MSRVATLGEAATRHAAGGATEPAVVDGATRWSWSDLDRHADAVAAGLGRAGVGVGSRVVVIAPPSVGAVAALHGIARAGAVAAPLGDRSTGAELAAALEVIDPAVVLVAGNRTGAITATGRPTVDLERLLEAPAGDDPPPRPLVSADAPAVIVPTSGTTGRSKAAILSAAAMVASAEAWLAALPPATGWLLAVGIGHVAGLGVVWRAALTGVPLVVLPRADTADIVKALRGDPAPSHASLVPTTLARLLDEVADAPPPVTLRAVLLGGGPIPPELVRRAIAAGWPVVPTYGLTEAGSGVTALATAEAAAHAATAGRALPGVRLRIDGPDDTGVGEIHIDSPARFSDYLGDPAATAAALTDDGWLRTGDLGRLDTEGRLTVVDRRTDRIVRGGENIAPAEVEAVLLTHPAIADAAVVARRDATLGQVPVAAIVVRANGPDPTDDELARFCRSTLSGFKVPVAFVRVTTLPRTRGGKLQRAALRAILDPDRTTQEQPA